MFGRRGCPPGARLPSQPRPDHCSRDREYLHHQLFAPISGNAWEVYEIQSNEYIHACMLLGVEPISFGTIIIRIIRILDITRIRIIGVLTHR